MTLPYWFYGAGRFPPSIEEIGSPREGRARADHHSIASRYQIHAALELQGLFIREAEVIGLKS